jgi:hypothetical protein
MTVEAKQCTEQNANYKCYAPFSTKIDETGNTYMIVLLPEDKPNRLIISRFDNNKPVDKEKATDYMISVFHKPESGEMYTELEHINGWLEDKATGKNVGWCEKIDIIDSKKTLDMLIAKKGSSLDLVVNSREALRKIIQIHNLGGAK